jgi:hypothetical protein
MSDSARVEAERTPESDEQGVRRRPCRVYSLLIQYSTKEAADRCKAQVQHTRVS